MFDRFQSLNKEVGDSLSCLLSLLLSLSPLFDDFERSGERKYETDDSGGECSVRSVGYGFYMTKVARKFFFFKVGIGSARNSRHIRGFSFSLFFSRFK